VQTSSDPVQLYKGFVEYTLRSKWNRPLDMDDASFVAEVEVNVDRKRRDQRSRLEEKLRQRALGQFGARGHCGHHGAGSTAAGQLSGAGVNSF
jgi:hypothetical protein